MASEGADGVGGSKAGGTSGRRVATTPVGKPKPSKSTDASGRRVATTPVGKPKPSKDLTDGKPRKPMKEDRRRGGREGRGRFSE